MAKNGVGIWKHYRTTDRADGFKTTFKSDGNSCRAKLYWAPADFADPDNSGRRPYLVVWAKVGDDELRSARYVGKERPHRSWDELSTLAESIDKDELIEVVADTIWYHNEMLGHGCTYSPYGCYNFPLGSDAQEIIGKVRAAYEARKKED